MVNQIKIGHIKINLKKLKNQERVSAPAKMATHLKPRVPRGNRAIK